MAIDLGPQSEPIGHRYRVIAQLGLGGQGAVWSALDELTGRRVAVKVIQGGLASPGARREIAVLRSLRLPSVVRLLDEGAWQGDHFVVTELIHGSSFPGRAGPVPWEVLAEPLRRLLVAVEQVHRAGVIHGDLKPANVLVDEDGQVHLLDFGMASFRTDSPPAREARRPGGTLHYLAPERILGQDPGPGSDLFSIGVMALRCLTGRPPWAASDLGELILARRKRGPTLPSELGLGVPPAVEEALARLLTLDPAQRPSFASEVLGLLGLSHSPARIALPWAPEGPPLSVFELSAAFHGPERILHLPGDAAALLHEATQGERARVAAEVHAWIDAGIAEPQGGRLRLARRTLDELRLHRKLPLAPPVGAPGPGDPRCQLLLAAICLAGEHARAPLLDEVMALPPGELEALLTRLQQTGAARVDPKGRWTDQTLGACLGRLPAADRHRLHQRIAQALDADAPERLRHLLAAGADLPALLVAAVRAMRTLLDAAWPGEALARAELVFGLLGPEHLELPATAELLDSYVAVALGSESPRLLARMAWELGRLPEHPVVHSRRALVEAAALALDGKPEEALARVTPLAARADTELRRMTVEVQVAAAQHLPVEGEAFVLDHLGLEGQAPPGLEAARLSWLGHLRFRQGRFRESAALHARSARGRVSLHARVSASLDESQALAEAGLLQEARQRTIQARLLAAEARDGALEARAWALQRRLAWREGQVDSPDEDLVEASHEVGEPGLVAQVAFTEAVIARDLGCTEATARLATRARTGFYASGQLPLAVLAAALGAEAGDAGNLWWASEHFPAEASGMDAGTLVQAAALLYLSTGNRHWAEHGSGLLPALQGFDLERPAEVMALSQAIVLVRPPF